MEITIQEITYKIKYSIRTLFVFEQIAKKSFEVKSLLDTYIFFYSMILANNPECTLTFDKFIDECDSNSTLINIFNDYVSSVMSVNEQLAKADEETDTKKK